MFKNTNHSYYISMSTLQKAFLIINLSRLALLFQFLKDLLCDITPVVSVNKHRNT